MIRSKGALNRPLDNPIFPEPDFTIEDNIALDRICWDRPGLIKDRVKQRLRAKATKYLKKYPSLVDQHNNEKDNLDILCAIYKSARVSSLSMKCGTDRVVNSSGHYPTKYNQELCCVRNWILKRPNFETVHVANFHGGAIFEAGPQLILFEECYFCGKRGSDLIEKEELDELKGNFFVLAFNVPMGFCNWQANVTNNTLSNNYKKKGLSNVGSEDSTFLTTQYGNTMLGTPIHNPLLSFLTEEDIEKYVASQNENLKKQEYSHLQSRVFFQADEILNTTIFNNEKKLNNIPLPSKKNICIFCLLKEIKDTYYDKKGNRPQFWTVVLNNCLDIQFPFSYSPMHLLFKFGQNLPIETHVKPDYYPSAESIQVLANSFDMQPAISNRIKSILGLAPLTCELYGQVKPQPTVGELLRRRIKPITNFLNPVSTKRRKLRPSKRSKRFRLNNSNSNNNNPKEGGYKKTKKGLKKHRKKRLSVIKKN